MSMRRVLPACNLQPDRIVSAALIVSARGGTADFCLRGWAAAHHDVWTTLARELEREQLLALRLTCGAFAALPPLFPLPRFLADLNATSGSHVQLTMASLEVCQRPAILGVLAGGRRKAGLEPLGPRAVPALPSPEQALPAVKVALGSFCHFPPGLIEQGTEEALHLELYAAHDAGLLTLVDKDRRLCVDINNPHKFAKRPDFPHMHRLLMRALKLSKAGRSVSSGGGRQEGGFRLHIRILPGGEHSTPGKAYDGHLDSGISFNISDETKQLYQRNPVELCAPPTPTPPTPTPTRPRTPSSAAFARMRCTALSLTHCHGWPAGCSARA